MAEIFLLKDALFNRSKVTLIAHDIARQYPAFKAQQFIEAVCEQFPHLELKARIRCISEQLRVFLPQDYRQAADVLMRALPPALDPNLSDNDFGDFIYAPFSDFVAQYGLGQTDFAFSLDCLYHITQRFSCEDAIRAFINANPTKALAQLDIWAKDSNYHVRRLCSEGTRPKLPWSVKVALSPEDAIFLLDQLYADRTRYVTRSVANHLNDIAKTHPDVVIQTLKRWRIQGGQSVKEFDFMVRHSLRTLIKAGYQPALNVLGYAPIPDLHVIGFDCNTAICPNGANQALSFSLVVQAPKACNALLDFVIHFQNKRGEMKSRKVFKWTTLEIAAHQPITLNRQHKLRADMTTRTLYAGTHQLDIQVNGVVLVSHLFELKL